MDSLIDTATFFRNTDANVSLIVIGIMLQPGTAAEISRSRLRGSAERTGIPSRARAERKGYDPPRGNRLRKLDDSAGLRASSRVVQPS